MHSHSAVLDCSENVWDLEALPRWTKVLDNRYPWDRPGVERVDAAQPADHDHALTFRPRDE